MYYLGTFQVPTLNSFELLKIFLNRKFGILTCITIIDNYGKYKIKKSNLNKSPVLAVGLRNFSFSTMSVTMNDLQKTKFCNKLIIAKR